jgi:hypothetical protein
VTQSQRIEKADELFQIFKTAPPAIQSNMALMWQIMTGMFRSRGREDLVQMLGPAPPPPEAGMPPVMPPAPPQGQGQGQQPPATPGIPGPQPA